MSHLSPTLSGHTYRQKHVEHTYLRGEKLLYRVTRAALEFFKKHLSKNASGLAVSQSIVIEPQRVGNAVTKLETPARSQVEKDYLCEMGQWHHRRHRRRNL